MAIYFTSDCHFGAERTLVLSKRPFDSVVEMDRALVNNWNRTVSKDDTVFVLGDFGEYHYTKFLNGKINLVKGNYERPLSHEYLKEYFDLVYLLDVINININYKGKDYKISMTHEPLNFKSTNFLPTENNILLFGHVHKLCMVKKDYGYNVGSDINNFTPVNMETVLFYHNSLFNYYDNNVFCQKRDDSFGFYKK